MIYFSLCLLAMIAFSSCEKAEQFKNDQFPGFTGISDEAIWVVDSYTIIDAPFLISTLPTQTPPTTYARFDSTLRASLRREATPFSYKIYKDGKIATIVRTSPNQVSWSIQNTLVWESSGSQMNIYRLSGAARELVAVGQKDQHKLLIKFYRAYFGDITASKTRAVLDIYYQYF